MFVKKQLMLTAAFMVALMMIIPAVIPAVDAQTVADEPAADGESNGLFDNEELARMLELIGTTTGVIGTSVGSSIGELGPSIELKTISDGSDAKTVTVAKNIPIDKDTKLSGTYDFGTDGCYVVNAGVTLTLDLSDLTLISGASHAVILLKYSADDASTVVFTLAGMTLAEVQIDNAMQVTLNGEVSASLSAVQIAEKNTEIVLDVHMNAGTMLAFNTFSLVSNTASLINLDVVLNEASSNEMMALFIAMYVAWSQITSTQSITDIITIITTLAPTLFTSLLSVSEAQYTLTLKHAVDISATEDGDKYAIKNTGDTIVIKQVPTTSITTEGVFFTAKGDSKTTVTGGDQSLTENTVIDLSAKFVNGDKTDTITLSGSSSMTISGGFSISTDEIDMKMSDLFFTSTINTADGKTVFSTQVGIGDLDLKLFTKTDNGTDDDADDKYVESAAISDGSVSLKVSIEMPSTFIPAAKSSTSISDLTGLGNIGMSMELNLSGKYSAPAATSDDQAIEVEISKLTLVASASTDVSSSLKISVSAKLEVSATASVSSTDNGIVTEEKLTVSDVKLEVAGTLDYDAISAKVGTQNVLSATVTGSVGKISMSGTENGRSNGTDMELSNVVLNAKVTMINTGGKLTFSPADLTLDVGRLAFWRGDDYNTPQGYEYNGLSLKVSLKQDSAAAVLAILMSDEPDYSEIFSYIDPSNFELKSDSNIYTYQGAKVTASTYSWNMFTGVTTIGSLTADGQFPDYTNHVSLSLGLNSISTDRDDEGNYKMTVGSGSSSVTYVDGSKGTADFTKAVFSNEDINDSAVLVSGTVSVNATGSSVNLYDLFDPFLDLEDLSQMDLTVNGTLNVTGTVNVNDLRVESGTVTGSFELHYGSTYYDAMSGYDLTSNVTGGAMTVAVSSSDTTVTLTPAAGYSAISAYTSGARYDVNTDGTATVKDKTGTVIADAAAETHTITLDGKVLGSDYKTGEVYKLDLGTKTGMTALYAIDQNGDRWTSVSGSQLIVTAPAADLTLTVRWADTVTASVGTTVKADSNVFIFTLPKDYDWSDLSFTLANGVKVTVTGLSTVSLANVSYVAVVCEQTQAGIPSGGYGYDLAVYYCNSSGFVGVLDSIVTLPTGGVSNPVLMHLNGFGVARQVPTDSTDGGLRAQATEYSLFYIADGGNGSNGLSTGVIIAIVVVVLLIVAAVAVYMVKGRKKTA